MHTAFAFHSRLAKQGSLEDLILSLARGVAERGDRVTFIFPACGVPALKQALAALGEVRIVPGPWTRRQPIHALGRLLARDPPDVLNTHFCDALPFGPLYLWARLAGIRVVPHYHGEILPFHALSPWRRFGNALRWVLRPAHEIITVSHANARYLAHLGVAAPVTVIHNGVDLLRFVPRPPDRAALSAYRLGPDDRYLLYVGSLVARKRIDVLLRAFVEVLRAIPELKLVVVGGGEIERYRALAGALGIGDAVHFTGLLEEFPFALLQGAELLVSASVQESFGLIFAEAMALGIPIVACRVGGIPEVVRNGEVGLLAAPDDAGDFADKVLRIAKDRLLRDRFAAHGRPRVAAQFNLADKVDLILQRLGHGPLALAPTPARVIGARALP